MPTESEARAIFADNLRWYSKQSGITQVEIATRLGVSTATVSDWFSGKKYPRPEKAQKLADFLGIRISDLQRNKAEREDTNIALTPVTAADLALIRKYHTLDEYGKEMVNLVLEKEAERVAAEAAPTPKMYHVKIAGFDGSFVEKDITEEEADAIRNLPEFTEKI